MDKTLHNNSALLFMEEAYKEAKKALSSEDVPVGSVLVEGEEIIGRGHNRREKDSDPTSHAELMALREAAKKKGNWNLSSCTLYTTLEPCVLCAGALVQARVSSLVYAASDRKGGVLSLSIPILNNSKLNHWVKVEKMEGEIEGRCSKLLRDFFKERRKK